MLFCGLTILYHYYLKIYLFGNQPLQRQETILLLLRMSHRFIIHIILKTSNKYMHV